MSFRRRGPVPVNLSQLTPREDGLVVVRVAADPEVSGYRCEYRGTAEQAAMALQCAMNALRGARPSEETN